MKIVTLLLVTSFFLTITGCSKSEQPGSFTPKLIWKAPLLGGKEAFSFSPVVYKDFVIYSSKYARLDHSEKPKVVAFNKDTGAKIWEWDDAQSIQDHIQASDAIYTFDNVLVMPTGARVYAIDMNTGKSLWSTKEPEGGGHAIYGIGNTIYHVRSNFDKKKDILLKADIATGNWKPVFIAEQQNMLSLIGNNMLTNKDTDGENYLYFTYSHTNLQYTSSELHLVKLNVRTDSVVFNKVLSNNNTYSITTIDDKSIYLSGREAISYSKNTGDLAKKYDLPSVQNRNYGAGQYILNKNKLFAPTDFPRFICYDIESGSILWTEEGISTSVPSKLIYHDGIIYYTSGSDGFLHAIDENGKRLWKFQSPDKKGSSGNFDDAISIDAAENRIYVSSYYNALCYETIKK